MKVLILLGGDSPEREVSLRSGEAVSEAAQAAGHLVHEYDPIHGYDGLDEFIGKVDAVLPIIHGVNGEDGSLQAQLEKRGFKFLGADSAVSKHCFDKIAFKKIISKEGFNTPDYEVVDALGYEESKLSTHPHVLKPIEGGSAIDSFIMHMSGTRADVSIFQKHPVMLLEKLITGKEITVPVLGAKALPVIEIIPPAGEDFDYENKYNGETQELVPPLHVSEDLQQQAQKIAETLHAAAGVRHLSRTDIIIDKDDKLWVLELNTMPGMTSQSLFPKAAAAAGMDMPKLIDQFLKLVTE